MTLVLQKATFNDPAQRLFELLDKAEPRFRTRFLNAIAFAKDEKTLAEIEALITAGRFEELFETIDKIAAGLSTEFNGVLVLSANDTSGFLSRSLGIITDFDQVNFRAVQRMTENRLRLIRGFGDVQREATRNALVAGIQEGANPIQQARNFRDSLGLTPNQEKSVRNFRRLLETNDRTALNRALRDRRFDGSFQRALREGKPLRGNQVDRMVERYRERFVRFRSETIARTESLRSVHEGTEAMYEQAIQEGTLDPQELIRTWNTARDVIVRDSHESMHGQKRKFGEPFISGKGNVLRFPGDSSAPAEETVRCRCALGTRFVA